MAFAAVGLIALMVASCNEKTFVDQVNLEAPVISQLSPNSATVNSPIIITGENLQHTKKVTIGGDSVEIKQRISSTQIVVVASSWASSGKVVAYNATGASTQDIEFTYSYAAPTLTEAPATADYGSTIMLKGTDLNAVIDVLFAATSGSAAPSKATIISRDVTEMVVQVPYVATDDAVVSFTYYNGTSNTPSPSTKTMTVIKKTPVVTTTSFPKTNVGKSITIEGNNLDKIDSVMVGGFKAALREVSSSSLTFAIPAANYVDGNNPNQSIVIHFFAGNETTTLTENFIAYVPAVMLWEQMTINAQDRTMEAFNSFFSPETGLVYENRLWSTVVDPISRQYTDKTCSAANIPAVSEAEYNSTKPYFFISGSNGGTLAVNGPAGSQGQLKNFFFSSASTDRVTVNGNCYGTPVVMWRVLSPGVDADLAVINAVKNRTIEKIDNTTFPIDAVNKTIAGMSVTTLTNNPNDGIWAPGLFPAGKDQTGLKPDAILMCVHLNHKGYAADTFLDNIKRIGFLHITNVDLARVNAASPSKSFMTFDMYWAKYDFTK